MTVLMRFIAFKVESMKIEKVTLSKMQSDLGLHRLLKSVYLENRNITHFLT